jgi:hypothetical protein
LKLLVRTLRAAWPAVNITVRADAGFCRSTLLLWCERHGVDYVIGLARNTRLVKAAESAIDAAERQFEKTRLKQRDFAEIYYAVKTWKRKRGVIVRTEHGAQGSNPRYVVTNRPDYPATIFDAIYCQRGEMENRINLEKAVDPQMAQISTDETKDLHKVLVHLLGDTQSADKRSIICAHLRNLRIELLFLGSRNSSSACSPIARVAVPGGQTSSGCCSHHSPTR